VLNLLFYLSFGCLGGLPMALLLAFCLIGLVVFFLLLYEQKSPLPTLFFIQYVFYLVDLSSGTILVIGSRVVLSFANLLFLLLGSPLRAFSSRLIPLRIEIPATEPRVVDPCPSFPFSPFSPLFCRLLFLHPSFLFS
jgi:hypothetical protein